MLAYLRISAKNQIDFAQSERLGLTYARPVLDLVKAAQNRRRAAASNAADLPALQQAVGALFEKVKARHGELGKTFGVEPSYDALLKAHEALMQRPVGRRP